MRQMPSAKVTRRLHKAASTAAVIAAARDYLAGWERSDFAKLPENCRPVAVENADDVQWWADTFSTEYESGEIVTPQLQAMYDFFLSVLQNVHAWLPQQNKTGFHAYSAANTGFTNEDAYRFSASQRLAIRVRGLVGRWRSR